MKWRRNSEEVIGTFYGKKFKNTNQSGFRIEKRKKKKKVNELYVKCKGFHNLFKSWIDKKDTIK